MNPWRLPLHEALQFHFTHFPSLSFYVNFSVRAANAPQLFFVSLWQPGCQALYNTKQKYSRCLKEHMALKAPQSISGQNAGFLR